MSNALDKAKSYLNVREDNGPNRSADIDRWNNRCHVPEGSNWCASFVTNCILEHCHDHNLGFDFVLTASSQAIRRWAEKAGRLSYDPNALLHWEGALFGWTNRGNQASHGHVGFVEHRWTERRNNGRLVVSAIGTVEGNTSPSGNRLGHGVFELRRGVPIDGQHKIWFVRLDNLSGCNWWSD